MVNLIPRLPGYFGVILIIGTFFWGLNEADAKRFTLVTGASCTALALASAGIIVNSVDKGE